MIISRDKLPLEFAVHINGVRSIITDQPDNKISSIITRFIGPHNVAIDVDRASFIVFNFADSGSAYNGGYVHGPEQGGTQATIGKEEQHRINLIYARTRYINAFLTTLWVGAQSVQHGLQFQPSANPGNVLWAFHQSNTHQYSGPTLKDYKPTGILNVNAIEKSSLMFLRIFDAYGERGLQILSLLQVASQHYNQHEFSSCLLIGWSSVEALLNVEWEELINKSNTANGGHTTINSKRQELLAGRDFTASIISQMLSIGGVINDSVLDLANKARQARNAFAHSLSPVTSETAALSVTLAAIIISSRSQTDFRVGLTYNYHS